MWGASVEMDLSLKQTNSIIKLCSYIEGLIRSSVVFSNKRRVVGRNFSDISVHSVAEFGIVITSR